MSHLFPWPQWKLLSPTLIQDQPLQTKPNEIIVKVISNAAWRRDEVASSTVSTAVETRSAHRRPLFSHKTSFLRRRRKQTLPPLQQDTEAQIMSQYTRQTTFHAQTITRRPPWGHFKQSPLAKLLRRVYTNLETRPRVSRNPNDVFCLIEVAWLTLALSWLKRCSPVAPGVVTNWDRRKREWAWASVLATPRAPRRSSWAWTLRQDSTVLLSRLQIDRCEDQTLLNIC